MGIATLRAWGFLLGQDLTHLLPLRFRKQRKAVVSSNDKKMPNGILEEQGIVHGVSGLSWKGTGVPSPVQLSLKPFPSLQLRLSSCYRFLVT